MGTLPLHPAVPVDPAAPVSTLELFLDLVFVFTVTQITTLVTHPHGAADEHAPAADRPQLALRGFGYGHVLMIADIIGIAAGIKLVVGPLDGPLDPVSAWSLAGGVSVYLLGDVLFRRVVGVGRVGGRLTLAGVSLTTAPLGLQTGGLIQLAVLVAFLAALLTVEGRRNDAGLV